MRRVGYLQAVGGLVPGQRKGWTPSDDSVTLNGRSDPITSEHGKRLVAHSTTSEIEKYPPISIYSHVFPYIAQPAYMARPRSLFTLSTACRAFALGIFRRSMKGARLFWC